MREEWLNGWKRNNSCILIGTNVVCCGCGKHLGLACVVTSESDVLPKELPEYPFEEEDCPVCSNRESELSNLSPEELATLPVNVLRKAMIIAKTKT